MAKLYCVVILGFIGAAISTASPLSEEDKNALKAATLPDILECAKEFEITPEAIVAAKDALDVDALDSCFYACFLKKRNVITEDGLYAPDVAKAEHAKYIHDADLLTKLDSVSDACITVNEKDVSDGPKGCDRANILVKCMTEHKDIYSVLLKD